MGTPVQPKQPTEIKAIGVTYVDFLASQGGDTIDTAEAEITEAPDGGTLAIDSVTHADGIVRVVVSAGADGERYTLRTIVNTTGGLREEVDFRVRVREKPRTRS